MKLLEYEELQRMVDYSFGDQSGVICHCPNAYMKKANMNNQEFINAVNSHKGEVMSLFIDNIRLYWRPIIHQGWTRTTLLCDQDLEWHKQFRDEDLLDLCSKFPHKTFVIFTAFEDTPLDEHIEGRIPPNVQSINATQCVYLTDKVVPMPHGLERHMWNGYNHHEILKKQISIDTIPSRLLYVNYNDKTDTTGHRTRVKEMLRGWATVVDTRTQYQQYLENIQDHKFILCPSGNGMGSARNWETLYLRRVPVLDWHPYKEVVFKGFPVLFVDDYSELTKELLESKDHLYQEALNIDMSKLDLDIIFNERIEKIITTEGE